MKSKDFEKYSFKGNTDLLINVNAKKTRKTVTNASRNSLFHLRFYIHGCDSFSSYLSNSFNPILCKFATLIYHFVKRTPFLFNLTTLFVLLFFRFFGFFFLMFWSLYFFTHILYTFSLCSAKG